MTNVCASVDIVNKVREKALHLLVRREHAPEELIRKLKQRGYEQGIAVHVVDELIKENLVNSERYAENIAHSYAHRGYGPNRIRAKLMAVNVDGNVISAVLSQLDIDWTLSAQTVRRKRFGDKHPSDYATYAKQMRFLQRRGFTIEQIRIVMPEIRDEGCGEY